MADLIGHKKPVPKKRRTFAATVAAAFALSVGAVSAQDYLMHPDNVPPEGKRGGKLVVGIDSDLIHPIGVIKSGEENIPGAQLNAGLLRFDKDYNPRPYLATSWEWANDGRTFKFELHPEARFHDGEDVTCTDVDFSIKTSQNYHPFKPMFAPVSGVDGGDTKSCAIQLSQPHPALMIALSPGLLPIIPEHIFNDGQEMPTHPRLRENVVGSGPFKLVEWDGGELIRFVRNEDFFLEGLPYLDEILIDVVPDRASLTLGLKSGAFDMVGVWNGPDILEAKKDPNLKVVDGGFEAIGAIPWVQINVRDPIMAKKEVRQALAYGYDFEEYNDIVFAGQNRRQCTGIQSQSPFYNPDAECYDLNIDKAKELLAAAGYPDGVELTVTVAPNNAAGAEVLKRQWAKIGVDLKIRMMPDEPSQVKEMVKENADYQMALVGYWNWGDPVIGVHRSYVCDNRKVGVGFSNMGWFCDPEIDEALAAAGAEVDVDKRRELYFHATDLINEQVPVIYLANEVWATRMQQSTENPPLGIWGWMDSWAESWVNN